MSRAEPRRAALLLIPAAVIGIAFGFLGSGGDAEEVEIATSGEVVARVDGVVLLAAEVDEALRAAGVDPGSASEEMRARALETLIDDELWFQAAVDDGLLQTHRGARDAVVRRMLDVIFPTGETFDEEVLRRLYDETYAEAERKPPFDKVRFRLEEEQLRRRNARALEEYLTWLRSQNRVERLADESLLHRALRPESDP